MLAYPIAARAMSERLLIRLQPDGQLAWLALDAQGRALSSANAGAPSAQALQHAQRVVVLVPAEEVLLLDTPRLSVARAQLRKAVPFALEDQLASPVEELHFAVADRAIGTRIPVAVIAAATLRDWLARLARDGIKPDALFAETQALPCSDGLGSVLIEDGRALWRLAPAQAGACDIAGLPDWLVLLVAGEGRAPAFEVHDFRDAPPLSLPVPPARYLAGQRDALAFSLRNCVTNRRRICCKANSCLHIGKRRQSGCGAMRPHCRWLR